MSAAKITNKDIRMFIMDKPELNPLLRGVRWNDDDIDNAVINVISFFNETSPPTSTSYTVETFPFRFTLLTGVVGHLLRGASVNEASNNLSYSLDGVQINDKDKAEIFGKLGQQFWEEFKEMSRNIKLQQNIAQVYGHFHSEHIFTLH